MHNHQACTCLWYARPRCLRTPPATLHASSNRCSHLAAACIAAGLRHVCALQKMHVLLLANARLQGWLDIESRLERLLSSYTALYTLLFKGHGELASPLAAAEAGCQRQRAVLAFQGPSSAHRNVLMSEHFQRTCTTSLEDRTRCKV